ncbi:MAG: Gfo/Idh/MocA family oxidoreductase [Actinobacteria bacterium]|nr:Gfo/Idh/MocA family oxidoreductase [Actinomycetota bacterium]
MEKIKVGIAGIGFAGSCHIENLRRLGNVEVVAVAGRNILRVKDKAYNMLIPRAYNDWNNLIKDKDIEAIHITTPNNLHFPIAKATLEAGKHVICEKPLALNSKEAKLLVDLANKMKLVNSVTFNLSFYPLIRQAKKIVSNKELGKILMVHGRYLQDWLSKDSDYNWRVEAEIGGKSRVIADIGSHWIHMIQLIIGKKIKSVFADSTTFITKRKKPYCDVPTHTEREITDDKFEYVNVNTEDYASILFNMEDNIKGCLVVSQVCPGRKQRIEWEISGSERSIAWCGENPNTLWIGQRDGYNKILMKGSNIMDKDVHQYMQYPIGLTEGYPDTLKNIFKKIYEHIANIKNNDPNKISNIEYPTFRDGYEIQLVIDSVLESIANKKWVNINKTL